MGPLNAQAGRGIELNVGNVWGRRRVVMSIHNAGNYMISERIGVSVM